MSQIVCFSYDHVKTNTNTFGQHIFLKVKNLLLLKVLNFIL